jgi:DNA processing protein
MLLTSAPAIDWLRLWRLVRQSEPALRTLRKHFPTPGAALAAAPDHWRELRVADVQVERLTAWQYGDDPALGEAFEAAVAADLAWCAADGQGLLALDHPDYPPRLREITDPPPLLFFRGQPALLAEAQVAVVGTRHPSLTGRADAEAFAGELARAGLVVTSGLARGVDAAAHQGALRAGGATVAVLGTGANRPYPRENTRLYLAIVERGGVVVSEFLPGEAPLAMHFPRRNRVISGLSLGVLVVEAAPESGSLITAHHGANQGRLVWALPGSRHNVQARGCLDLIREGVTAVTEVDHILQDVQSQLGAALPRPQAPAPSVAPEASAPLSFGGAATPGVAGTAAVPEADLEPGLRLVLDALGEEARHPDAIIDATGVSPVTVLRALSRLEIAGHIAAVPGGYARRPR